MRTGSVWVLICMAFLGGCATRSRIAAPPAPPREFRGLWVATVSNIDWPSKPALSVQQQQRELIDLLDGAAAANLNAVILQVRPMADALYDSPLEPWSVFLTGQSGQAPQPHYDPLAFAVQQAHQRGLQLHAWINPYRAGLVAQRDRLADSHIAVRRADVVREYGQYLWLDPSEPDATRHTLAVVCDLVRRYDLDGIHMDDYFYPYPVRDKAGHLIDFPDDANFARYQQAGGKLERDDWRRNQVDQLVQQLYRQVKRIKPHVLVGISPFGIWRPGYPPQVRGFDQFGQLYADPRLWLHQGWCDYLSPQLYWPIAPPQQSYIALLSWWLNQNPRHRHIWPGLSIARVDSGSAKSVDAMEIAYQIQWTRWLTQDDSPGVLLFSQKHLARATSSGTPLGDILREHAFTEPVLPPVTDWLKVPRANQPQWQAQFQIDDQMMLVMEPDPAAFLWLIQQQQSDGQWTTHIVPAAQQTIELATDSQCKRIVVRAVDRLGRLSPPNATPSNDMSGDAP
ncbi:MAG: family 10 glycosylhydrolase [Phycisphaeraceae bacterium]|nr:family 10 glycosylhydrolase [Phycisphaeraceae bacterium]